MKIVYCIAGLFNSAGMERVITNKANYFANKGHDVFIITAEQDGRDCFYTLDDRIKLYDLDINYSKDLSIIGKFLHFFPKTLKHIRSLKKLLFKIKADVVVSTFGNEFFFLYKIKDGSKKVAEVHFCKNYRMKRDRGGFWKVVDYIKTKLEEIIVIKYDSFITLTNEDISSWGMNDNIRTIPNALTFLPEQTSSLSSHKLLVVGRLNYQKGIDRILDIWKDVSPDFPEWSLHIYGSGELYDHLQSQIDLYNLSTTAFIHPPTTNIHEVYLDSSCYLMTSRYEGLPMVLLEAMSFGLPVISYACPCGPKDLIIDGYNGYLVEDGDSQVFKKRLTEIIEQVEIRKEMGINARKSVLTYGEDHIMQKWEILFNDLLQ